MLLHSLDMEDWKLWSLLFGVLSECWVFPMGVEELLLTSFECFGKKSDCKVLCQCGCFVIHLNSWVFEWRKMQEFLPSIYILSSPLGEGHFVTSLCSSRWVLLVESCDQINNGTGGRLRAFIFPIF